MEQTLAQAVRLDLDSAWLIDHFTSFVPRALWRRGFSPGADKTTSPHALLEFQVLLGHLAGRAENVQLGVGVTDAMRRHPVLLAQAALTLAHLLSRPFILGLGTGERMNTEPYGVPFSERTARLDEALRTVRTALGSEGPFDFEGRFYRLDGAVMDLVAPAGRTPQIWVAAHGPRTLELAGRYGDGWLPTLGMAPECYAASLVRIRRAAVAAGRDPASVTPAMQMMLVVGNTRTEARRMLGTPPVRLWALLHPARFWRKLGQDHPLGDRFGGLVDLVPEQIDDRRLRDAMEHVPEPIAQAAVTWGDPDDLLTAVARLVEVGCRHVILNQVPGMPARRWDEACSVFSLARRVKEEVRA